MTQEDIDIVQGVVNSLTFVRSGLNDNEQDKRELISQALKSLTRVLYHDGSDYPKQVVERAAKQERYLSWL